MQHIQINGENLDLAADFSLSIVRTNFLFGFDNVSCDRSTSFDIPGTPRNNRLLTLSGDINGDGLKMRTKTAAKLVAGAMSWDGYLFLDSYDYGKRVYSGNFIFGELLPLYDMKQAGKISEILPQILNLGSAWLTSDSSKWTSAGTTHLASTYTAVAYGVDPNGEDNKLHPSFDVEYLLTQAATALSTNITFPTNRSKYRLITGGVKNFTVQGLGRMVQSDTHSGTEETTITPDAACSSGTIWSKGVITLQRTAFGTTTQYTISAYKAETHVTITFPANVPSNIHLIQGGPLAPVSWEGWDYIDSNPIAGRTYDVPRGTILAIVDRNNYEDTGTIKRYTTFEISLFDNPQFTVRGIDGEELVDGQLVRGVDNLPEVGFVELLQAWATLEGKVLYYDGATNTFSFDSLNVDTWNETTFDKVIEIGKVERGFGNWAQDNVVSFNSGEEVAEDNRVKAHYYISNVNIEKEKDIQTMPFSEGSGTGVVMTNGSDLVIAKKPTSASAVFLNRVTIPTISALTSITNKSTVVDMKAVCSALQYAMLSDKSLIRLKNTLFVWTEAEWEDDKISLNLAKLY